MLEEELNSKANLEVTEKELRVAEAIQDIGGPVSVDTISQEIGMAWWEVSDIARSLDYKGVISRSFEDGLELS